MELHYLDNAATTQVSERAAQTALRLMREKFGNPSSLHAMGFEAEKSVRAARREVASLLGCRPEELLFTSCATESNNLAVKGAVRAARRRGNHLITTETEHPSVYNAFKALESEGFEVEYVPVGENGIPDPGYIASRVRKTTLLVSAMLVNNETGIMSPVAEIAAAVKRVNPDTLVHTDAVQAAGRTPVDFDAIGVDLLSVSGHKLHAPKGVGALAVKKGVRLTPLLDGGGQEKGLRSGTEASELIAAFGVAASEAAAGLAEFTALAVSLREYALRETEKREYITVLNRASLPYMLNLSVAGCKSETLLHILEGDGVYVSSGSACSKGKKSRVLKAQGLDDGVIDSFLRVSLSRYSNEDDLRALFAGLDRAYARLR